MKRYFITIFALIMVLSLLYGCERTVVPKTNEPKSTEIQTAETSTTDPETMDTETCEPETSVPDTFEPVDTNDQVETVDEDSDQELLAKAQEIYNKAYTTYWDILLTGNFEQDCENTIENDKGHTFALITAKDVTSMKDVESQWLKVFHKDFTVDLAKFYFEKDSKLWRIQAERGSDSSYSHTVINAILSKGENTITYNAVSYYNDCDSSEIYKQENEFTTIKTDDGWRVLEFKIPN